MNLKVKRSGKAGSYRIYLPKHIGEQFEGEVKCSSNAIVIVLARRDANVEQITESLSRIQSDCLTCGELL